MSYLTGYCCTMISVCTCALSPCPRNRSLSYWSCVMHHLTWRNSLRVYLSGVLLFKGIWELDLNMQRGFETENPSFPPTTHLWSCRNRVLFVPVHLHSLVPLSIGDLRACTYCRKIALSYAHSTDSNSIGEDLNALSDSACSVSVLDPGEPRTPVGSRKASRNIFLEEDLTWQR